jgi:sugar phosphate isomerase/epimerase
MLNDGSLFQGGLTMITRRDFLQTVGGVAVLAAGSDLFGAGGLAWTKPIGLELYTVRELFAKDPAGTLKKVAAVGYKEVEVGPGAKPGQLHQELSAAGLTAPSGYFESPKTVEEWKKTVGLAHAYGLRYVVVGDNPKLDLDAWKRRADLYNQCGEVAQHSGMQFCYHAHFNELARLGDTTGYDIMLKNCDARHLQMEMDVFWVTYAGADPLHYFQTYPGRFPLLHIKDLYKNVSVNSHESPPDNGPNPFAPVGQGKIDWKEIFAHVGEAGTKHIYVEQDRCNLPPLEAIKISYDYLKGLHLA